MISLSCRSYSIGEEGNHKSNGANNKMEKQESDNNQRLIIRGEVKFIDRGNIDKSGRNPQFQIQINYKQCLLITLRIPYFWAFGKFFIRLL